MFIKNVKIYDKNVIGSPAAGAGCDFLYRLKKGENNIIMNNVQMKGAVWIQA